MDHRDFQIRARFRHALKRACLEDQATLLVAVSGGCDSVSLLHLCADEAPSRSWRLLVGHVDHGLRPGSAADALWVEELAGSLGLPFCLRRVPPESWPGHPGDSLEESARRIRRRLLRELAREHGAEWILLGHNRDDQAETLLLNLLRGSGVRGLGGMAPRRPPWLRPLLQIGRKEIREYALRRGLTWREDPSNQDLRFLRNRLRLRLLPLLREEFQPAVDRVLARTSDSLRPLRAFLADAAETALGEVCIEQTPFGIRLDRRRLASYHRAVIEEVLRRTFRRLRGSARDLKRAHLAGLVRALRQGQPGTFHLPAGISVCLDHREIRFAHQKDEWTDAG